MRSRHRREMSSASMQPVLAALLSPDLRARQAAEAHINQHGGQPGFATGLCDVLVDASARAALRQMAGVVLKQLIRQRWPLDTGGIAEEEKARLRARLPQALADNSRPAARCATPDRRSARMRPVCFRPAARRPAI